MAASTPQTFALSELKVLFGNGQNPLLKLKPVRLETCYGINQIPSAKICLRGMQTIDAKRNADQAKDIELCKPGTEAIISHSGGKLFTGIVVAQRLELRVGFWELTLKLKHGLQRLVASYQSQVFEKQNDKQIISSLLNANGMKPGKLEEMQIEHAQMVQFGCSDWQFLKARLGANGVWLSPTPESHEVVDVVKPAMGGESHTLNMCTADKQEQYLERVELELDIQNLPPAVEVSGWDITEQKMSDAAKGQACELGKEALSPSTLQALNKTPWSFTRSLPLTVDEQLALAQARLLTQQAAGIRARFTLNGNTKYKLGDTLHLEGLGPCFEGAGIITEVNHKIADGQWHTTIALGLEPASTVDSKVVPEAVGLHIGVVESYEEDPSGLNRLRVSVPALLGNKPLWARFAMPYASNDSGLCFYPEVNDEVVLGFFEADPRYPVILGAMHNPKNKAPFPPSKDNPEKAMILVRGETKQKLVFNVQEASMLLENNAKERITLKQGIQIEGDEQLSSSAKKVVFKADEGMQLQATQDLKLESQKGIAMEATKVEAHAKSQLTLEGSAGVKIKGAMVDLSN